MGKQKGFYLILCIVVLAIGVLYFSENFNPIFLLLLICPLMHVFMHRGHKH